MTNLLTAARCILSGVLAGQADLLAGLQATPAAILPLDLDLARPDAVALLSPEPTMPSSTHPTAADAMLAPEIQVSDHSSIDRALDVLRGRTPNSSPSGTTPGDAPASSPAISSPPMERSPGTPRTPAFVTWHMTTARSRAPACRLRT